MENNYVIAIRYSECDNCYLAAVPDLPGCIADGITPEVAYDNARAAIREWIETARELGRDVPEPNCSLFNF